MSDGFGRDSREGRGHLASSGRRQGTLLDTPCTQGGPTAEPLACRGSTSPLPEEGGTDSDTEGHQRKAAHKGDRPLTPVRRSQCHGSPGGTCAHRKPLPEPWSRPGPAERLALAAPLRGQGSSGGPLQTTPFPSGPQRSGVLTLGWRGDSRTAKGILHGDRAPTLMSALIEKVGRTG